MVTSDFENVGLQAMTFTFAPSPATVTAAPTSTAPDAAAAANSARAASSTASTAVAATPGASADATAAPTGQQVYYLDQNNDLSVYINTASIIDRLQLYIAEYKPSGVSEMLKAMDW